MLIECSSCRAAAQIPEDAAGSPVRCAACGVEFVARAHVRARRQRVDPVTLWIAGGAAAAIAAFTWAHRAHRASPPPAPPPAVESAPRAPVDETGWDSELVKLVRDIYGAAASGNEALLAASLDGARIAQRRARAAPERAVDFAALDAAGKLTFVLDIAQELIHGTDRDAPHAWEPFEGGATLQGPLEATVRVTADERLAAGKRSGAAELAETRTYEWKLARPDEQSRWKAWSWEHVATDDERRAALARDRNAVTQITLPTGETLFQAELRHVDESPGTPPEVRARIAVLIATMLDFSLRPIENNRARDELVALGKPAIPQLLNQLCDLALADAADDPSLAQLNLIDGALRRITSYPSSFSALPGQTKERRTIALKAWFAWWERKGKLEQATPAGGG